MDNEVLPLGTVISIGSRKAVIVGYDFTSLNQVTYQYYVVPFPLGFINWNSVKIVCDGKFNVVSRGFEGAASKIYTEYLQILHKFFDCDPNMELPTWSDKCSGTADPGATEKSEMLLPVGSVVSLGTDGEFKALVIGYYPKNKENSVKHEYICVAFPYGLKVRGEMFGVCKSRVHQVLFSGFTTAESKTALRMIPVFKNALVK